jgi:transcriptional regulator with XRE-family HTH domain
MAEQLPTADSRCSDVLRELRQRSGLTLRRLSERLQEMGYRYSVEVLSKMERGNRRFWVNDIEPLAAVFGVSDIDFFTGRCLSVPGGDGAGGKDGKYELSDRYGYGGTVGPFPGQYLTLHVYARDIHSGYGHCVCGAPMGDARHYEIAPGMPTPEHLRS